MSWVHVHWHDTFILIELNNNDDDDNNNNNIKEKKKYDERVKRIKI